ncbi:MAG: Crp/Fnr family transcriptional regulator [Nitrospira bacterium SG8_3]|nr:MAG: Crp/Fnr family transcriptional regulator [Nitrospira bacterium SG8_3]
MEKAEKILAEHPFLEGLDPELLKIIASCATEMHFEPGQMIYREGDEANQFLLVRDGKVAIEVFSARRGSLIIHTAGAGHVVGWSWLFPPYKRRFDTRAVEATTAVALDGKFLREKAEEDHRLGYELLKRFSKIVVERLQETRLQLVDIYGKHS